jgi:hypothetical protein
MAQHTTITYTDDITNKPCSPESIERVQVTSQGFEYTLEVSGDTYRKIFEPIIEAAPTKRRVGSDKPIPVRPNASGTERPKTDKAQNAAIRAWWETNKGRGDVPATVSMSGRIPQTVLDAFQAAKGMTLPAMKFTDGVEPKPALTRAESRAVVSAAPAQRTAKKSASPRKAAAKAAAPVAARARKRA